MNKPTEFFSCCGSSTLFVCQTFIIIIIVIFILFSFGQFNFPYYSQYSVSLIKMQSHIERFGYFRDVCALPLLYNKTYPGNKDNALRTTVWASISEKYGYEYLGKEHKYAQRRINESYARNDNYHKLPGKGQEDTALFLKAVNCAYNCKYYALFNCNNFNC